MNDDKGAGLLAVAVFAVAAIPWTACKVQKELEIVNADEASGILVMQYEHEFEDCEVKWDEAREEALGRCRSWGHAAVEFSEAKVECLVPDVAEPKEGVVVSSEDQGMGTPEAERQRSDRGLGTVGCSITQESFKPGCNRWRVTYIAECKD